MDKKYYNRLVAKMAQEAVHDADWRSLLAEIEIEQCKKFLEKNAKYVYFLYTGIKKSEGTGAIRIICKNQFQWVGINELNDVIRAEIYRQAQQSPKLAFLLWGKSPIIFGFQCKNISKDEWKIVRSQLAHPGFEFQ